MDDKEDTESLEHADRIKPGDTGLYCFLDAGRACGAECVAYVTTVRSAKSPELGEQQSHCILVSSLERVGRSGIGIAGMMASAQKRKSIAEADKARNEQLVPKSAVESPFGAKL